MKKHCLISNIMSQEYRRTFEVSVQQRLQDCFGAIKKQ